MPSPTTCQSDQLNYSRPLMSWKRSLRNSLFFAGLALQAQQPNYPQGWTIAPPNDPWWKTHYGKAMERQICRLCRQAKTCQCVKAKKAARRR